MRERACVRIWERRGALRGGGCGVGGGRDGQEEREAWAETVEGQMKVMHVQLVESWRRGGYDQREGQSVVSAGLP